MKQILCLASEPWSSSPGRTQQLISRFKNTQILYFHPASGRKDRSFLDQSQRVRANIAVYTLPPIRFRVAERHRVLFQSGQKKLARFIAEKAARHQFSSPLLWTTNPRHVHLLDRLSYDGLVYDCDREWDSLPPEWEGSLASAADLVFTASNTLRQRLAPCSSNIVLLPNGVNYPLFANRTPGPRPELLPSVSGPVLGWAGTVSSTLDLSPLLYAAQERPGWTFVLLGKREDNPFLPRLRALPNVVFAGPCPLTEVPEWLYRCDVLLEFLQEDRADDGVISSRVYEYLSTGKPVVAMLWPGQVERFPDVVYGAHDEREFVMLCEHAMSEAEDFVSQRRRSHGAEAAWSLRADQVSRILVTSGLL